MSSIKRISGGKVSDVIESVPYMTARKLIADGHAVDANTAAPVPKVQEGIRNEKRVIDLANALEEERKEKVELFDELEKAAKEKADMQKRIAELEEAAASAAKNTSGGKTK